MTHIPEVQIHNILGIRAKAKKHGTTSWLELMFHDNESDAEITAFMPYETALEYANAINSCNDREMEEAYIPNENTVHIPMSEWRKLNMGVPDASKDSDSND